MKKWMTLALLAALLTLSLTACADLLPGGGTASPFPTVAATPTPEATEAPDASPAEATPTPKA